MTRKFILLVIAIIVLVSLNWFNEAKACDITEQSHSAIENAAFHLPCNLAEVR